MKKVQNNYVNYSLHLDLFRQKKTRSSFVTTGIRMKYERDRVIRVISDGLTNLENKMYGGGAALTAKQLFFETRLHRFKRCTNK